MTITKPFRLRRVLKWAGVGACVVILVGWGLSIVGWEVGYRQNQWEFTAMSSILRCSRFKNRMNYGAAYMLQRDNGFGLDRFGLKLPYLNEHTRGSRMRLRTTLGLPVWTLFSIPAALTTFLFYRDRRRIPPGHCQQCGYNLTGNVSGVCSECGVGV